MTPQEAAAKLNDNEYGSEGSKELFAEMKTAGLVAVFGASDDLIEFRGAINDEEGAYGGGISHITPCGLFKATCQDEDCPHEEKLRDACRTIEAVWDDGEYSWTYKTEIPHVTFDILEDGHKYCRGIVFALADVPA